MFKATVGLLEKFGPKRVRDCPISEQAILGAAMGAAMTGLRPIAEIMFSDFLAVCWDIVANEIAKTRYMTNGQITLPLVIRTANGAGSRFGAQHSQAVENWAMAIPGIKVVAPAFPADVKGLLAAAVRDPDPVLFFEQKSLYSMKGEVPDGEHVDELGKRVLRQGKDCTIVALASMVHKSLDAAEILQKEHGISCTVVDVRSLVPLDTQTILSEVVKTGRLVTVEENPRLCGWGAEIASIAADECFWDLDGPILRITTPHVPLPSADRLEDDDDSVGRAHRARDPREDRLTPPPPPPSRLSHNGRHHASSADGRRGHRHQGSTKVGDSIKADETCSMSKLDKVSTEIPAPVSGVVAEIRRGGKAASMRKVGARLTGIRESRAAASASRIDSEGGGGRDRFGTGVQGIESRPRWLRRKSPSLLLALLPRAHSSSSRPSCASSSPSMPSSPGRSMRHRARWPHHARRRERAYRAARGKGQARTIQPVSRRNGAWPPTRMGARAPVCAKPAQTVVPGRSTACASASRRTWRSRGRPCRTSCKPSK